MLPGLLEIVAATSAQSSQPLNYLGLIPRCTPRTKLLTHSLENIAGEISLCVSSNVKRALEAESLGTRL